jgi:hypothetical protein
MGLPLNRHRIMRFFPWNNYDPDAAAYIAAVETALGSSITETQKTAIDVFSKAEKLASRWTSIKRLYLPIWGNAAANAVCLKSLASGTFVGGVTHGAGYVQGDGSTGYFDFGVSASTLGLTTSGGSVFALVQQSDSRTDRRHFTGAWDASNRRVAVYQLDSATIIGLINSSSVSVINGSSGRNGIFLAVVNTTTSRYLKRRTSAGVAYTTTQSVLNGVSASTINQYALGANITGSLTDPTNARMGSYGLCLGLDSADGDAFTLNLKTLWETCTGLTLP